MTHSELNKIVIEVEGGKISVLEMKKRFKKLHRINQEIVIDIHKGIAFTPERKMLVSWFEQNKRK